MSSYHSRPNNPRSIGVFLSVLHLHPFPRLGDHWAALFPHIPSLSGSVTYASQLHSKKEYVGYYPTYKDQSLAPGAAKIDIHLTIAINRDP